MLLLVGIFDVVGPAPAPGICRANDRAIRISEFSGAFAPDKVLGHIAPTAGDMAALTRATRAIGIFELDKVVVEDFTIVGPFAHFTTAHALGANRVALFNPIYDIEVVDVLLD